MVNNNQVDLRFQLKLTFHLYFLRDIYKNVETISLNQNLISIWIYHVLCFLSLLIVQVFNAGNNILNPGGYRDQIIPLLNSARSVIIFLKILSANMVGRRRKFCNLDRLKQPFQRFFTIFYSKIQHLFSSKPHLKLPKGGFKRVKNSTRKQKK